LFMMTPCREATMPIEDPTYQSGIYQIRCLVDGKVYVGSAVNFRKRWTSHQSQLSRRRHHSRHLQGAWQKHGADQFVFEVLEVVPEKADLARIEQEWLDRTQSFNRSIGFNLSPTAGSALGVKLSPETCVKRSAAMKGRKLSPETRAKVAAAK